MTKRVAIVWDRQPIPGTLPIFEEIFRNVFAPTNLTIPPTALTFNSSFQSSQNASNIQRFHVLLDDYIQVPSMSYTTSANNGTNNNVPNINASFKIDVDEVNRLLRKKGSNFSDLTGIYMTSSQYINQNSITNGQVYLVTIPNNDTNVPVPIPPAIQTYPLPKYTAIARIYYSDES